MKIKISLIVLTFISMFGLVACSLGIFPVSPSPVATSIKFATVTPPASTLFPVIDTHTPESSCVSVAKQSPQNLPIQGKIILSALAPFTTPSYLMDLSSGEKIILPQEENKIIVDSSFSTSPNREWLEYAQVNTDSSELIKETLHIATADGVEHKVISMNIDQRGSMWTDNGHLLIENLREHRTSSPEKAPATLWLLNAFTGEKRELFNDYPNQWNGDSLDWEFTLSRVIYNPALTRVIYPTFVGSDRIMRLVDVQTNEILADIPTTDYGKFPAWSPNGKWMMFATQTNKQAGWDSYQDEIFTLTEDGELSQLTHLSKTNNYSYITGLSWSADSRYIAFLVNNTDWEKAHTGVHLAILDTYTKEVREYCNMGNSDKLVYVPELGSPIWSPDGKYLLVNLHDPNFDQHIFVVLVEVSTGNTFQVSENYQAVGWLK